MSYLLTLIFAVHMHLYKIYVILSLKCCPCNGKEKENWHPEESKLNLYRVEYLGQGRRRRSGRTASAGPLFWTSMLSAVSLFSHFGSFLNQKTSLAKV